MREAVHVPSDSCAKRGKGKASELIQKKVFGVFGDPKGYEESLYKTKEGKFFLYGFGGPESPYTEETIKRLAADKVKAWQKA